MYSIHIRVTIDRETNYINPKLPKIESKYWIGKQNKWVRESHPNSYEVNSLLQQKLTELDSYIVRTRLMGRPVSFASINEFYFKQGDATVVNDFAKEYVTTSRDFALNTIKVYRTFLKHLDGFNPRIKFADLNEGLLNSFKEYLQIETGLKGAATKKYFDKFKVICKEAVKKGYMEVNQNPFYYSELRIKIEKPRRTFLSSDEIRAIKDLELTGSDLEKHRDLFLFQLYSGLYYKDLKELRKESLNWCESGPYIIGNRIKNDNFFISPIYIFPHSKVILAKYEDPESHLLFPGTISDQKFNKHLKTIGDLAGINKNVTNKVARHSYVQLLMSAGLERQYVSRTVGHSEEDTTQEYYDISIYDMNSRLAHVSFEDL